ncbi:zinc finger protein RFP-like isoform X2 [Dermochelys coriacea]|uniref:zinc finger protein RFP-like isoform X2 n=1 Tax=Dermochelys coriacea TaxID=27794 RepID=UPI001CA86FEC|nr:zinc finger protein RFP-like isoform X2 [Dermochelys coriacea]
MKAPPSPGLQEASKCSSTLCASALPDTMAAANPAKTLQEEATCSICLDYFKDPVMIIDCGHNFCRACITQCLGQWKTNLSCPCCKGSFPQRHLKPNRQLANVAVVAKQLSLQLFKEPRGGRVCEKHLEALKLFCEEDQTPICVVCDRSKEHRAHTVVPIEEAAQEYKVQIQSHLEILKKERAEILAFQSSGEMKSKELLKEVEAERQKVVSEFQQLRVFLEEQERYQLGRLGKLDKEIVKMRDENATKYSKALSCLNDLVCEMEGKCQQPASEFLQVVRSTLSRYVAPSCCQLTLSSPHFNWWRCKTGKGKFQNPTAESPDWRRRLKELSQETILLQNAVKEFKESLPSETLLESDVYFDPDTAHPRFVVSKRQKSVRWGDTRQDLPYSPKRFDPSRCVLGCEGFTSGKHCWMVDVGEGGNWAVGVARESVRRKGEISLDPEGGIWAIGLCRGQYRVLTSPVTLLTLNRSPTRIVVYLQYEKGLVIFIDFDKEATIFSFLSASFTGEKIFPFFRVGDMQTHLKLLL